MPRHGLGTQRRATAERKEGAVKAALAMRARIKGRKTEGEKQTKREKKRKNTARKHAVIVINSIV